MRTHLLAVSIAVAWFTLATPAQVSAQSSYDQDCRDCGVILEQELQGCKILAEAGMPTEAAECVVAAGVKYSACLFDAWMRSHFPKKKPCTPTTLEDGSDSSDGECVDEDDPPTGGGGSGGGGSSTPPCHQEYAYIEENDGYGWYTIWEGWVTVCG